MAGKDFYKAGFLIPKTDLNVWTADKVTQKYLINNNSFYLFDGPRAFVWWSRGFLGPNVKVTTVLPTGLTTGLPKTGAL